VINALARFCFGVLLIASFSAVAEAQQVCYAYDRVGRLSGVIDQNNNAAFYQYDAVGNILSVRRASPSGPVTIYAVYPLSGAPGEQFEIFGVGLSAVPNQNQVTIGGVSANVVSTVPCTLIVEVPPDGITGQIHVTTPSGQTTSPESFLVSRFAIAGTAIAVLPNTLVQYTVVSNGCDDPAVVWRVNGTVGGIPLTGTISTNGLYTSPPAIPNPAYVVIRADSVGCPTLFDEKTLNLVTSATTFVLAAASAVHGAPPVLFPPTTVMASASARFGSAPVVLPPNTVLGDASAANVPVITAMAPNSSTRPSAFQITVTGVNLTGATGLTFFGTSAPDSLITVSNVTVNANGTSLTANVSMAPTAVIGTRTIRVDKPGGNSTAVRTAANVFTVTQ
jgi:YD repeat-containing protein